MTSLNVRTHAVAGEIWTWAGFGATVKNEKKIDGRRGDRTPTGGSKLAPRPPGTTPILCSPAGALAELATSALRPGSVEAPASVLFGLRHLHRFGGRPCLSAWLIIRGISSYQHPLSPSYGTDAVVASEVTKGCAHVPVRVNDSRLSKLRKTLRDLGRREGAVSLGKNPKDGRRPAHGLSGSPPDDALDSTGLAIVTGECKFKPVDLRAQPFDLARGLLKPLLGSSQLIPRISQGLVKIHDPGRIAETNLRQCGSVFWAAPFPELKEPLGVNGARFGGKRPKARHEQPDEQAASNAPLG